MGWAAGEKLITSNMDGSHPEDVTEAMKVSAGVHMIGKKGKKLFRVSSQEEGEEEAHFEGTWGDFNHTFSPSDVIARHIAVSNKQTMSFKFENSIISVIESRKLLRNYSSSDPINQLATPSSVMIEYDRGNDCVERNPPCNSICVLTPESSKCLPGK